MTILPKKPKPPHAQSSSQSGQDRTADRGGDNHNHGHRAQEKRGDRGEQGRGGPGGTGEDGGGNQGQEENQVVPGGNGGPGWGPAGFDGGGPTAADWTSSSARSSPPSWSGQSSGAEKRPAPSSVSAYGFDDDDDDEEEEEEEDDAGAVVVGEGPSAVQCQSTATKRSRRSLVGGGSKKRMKGSPLVSSSAVVGVPKSSVGVTSVADRGAQGVQGAVAAALAASRPAVAPSPPLQGCSSWGDGSNDDVDQSGYNSEDEYSHLGVNLTEEEWQIKDRRFEKSIRKKGYIIKETVEDGSCLFRAVADQVFGDQEMHMAVRTNCMDYILQNADYFRQYVTEDIELYCERKRFPGVHGNHLEIQALSEMYNRPIHIFSYGNEPINIFQTLQKSDKMNAPIRLSYHRGSHYNSVIDPHKATIGVGLGLPGHSPGSADRNLLRQAVSASEETLVEKAMLEDKLKATDWEATNEAIEEQVARESYLQWLKDNEKRSAAEQRKAAAPAASTVTSGELRSAVANAQNQLQQYNSSGHGSPKACCSKFLQLGSPIASKSTSPVPPVVTERGSPVPCSSTSQPATCQRPATAAALGLGEDFRLNETESFMNNLPADVFGLQNEWGERDALLAQVLAASQQEYFDSLKRRRQEDSSASTSPSNSRPDTPK